MCVAIEPSGSTFSKFSRPPREEGTIYRAPTSGEESERGPPPGSLYEYQKKGVAGAGVCMSMKAKEIFSRTNGSESVGVGMRAEQEKAVERMDEGNGHERRPFHG